MINIETNHVRGANLADVAGDIDQELTKFDSWLCVEKNAGPLTSYERGILRTYLIYLIQRGPNAGTEDTV